ncbi:hypothetical protein [Usitatibacter rugosus]|uniref:hypothetical protein n=1 Tax=Usitatibacter rugosus TaxID=2732067 RepID=UPI001489F5A9|nr:hypothetical protein [Usitatibacter rugosus]
MIRFACFLLAILGLPGPYVFLLGLDSAAPPFEWLSEIGALVAVMLVWIVFFLVLSIFGRNPFFSFGAYIERQRASYEADAAKRRANR